MEVWRVGDGGPTGEAGECQENVTRLDACELFPGLELELDEIWGV